MPQSLGEYLAQKKIRSADFAPRVGLTPEGLRLILKGKRKASPNTARKIELETDGAIPKSAIRPDLWDAA